ncbi:MAG TPA: SRPBCC family protein [Thermomicrobiaceae bacterium]|nr:SRPBCC family protein [Thermomicrobiaceae bacterium]
MANVQKSIDVNVPVRTAYDQWTQFESFPNFMDGVHEVEQVDDTHLRWRAKIGGKEEEWDAKITQQDPDRVIAWRSITGAENGGRVSFEPLATNMTRVMLDLDYEPDSMVESIGDKLGFMSRQVESDLDHFKSFIESRGTATGSWRGEVRDGMTDTKP